MVNAPYNVLEELLLERIERELTRQGGRLADREGVRTRVRSELSRTDLSDFERNLIEGGAGWSGGDPVLEAVSWRLESALRAGLVLARAGTGLTLSVPRIVVAPDDPDVPPETVLRTLGRTLTAGPQLSATLDIEQEGIERSSEVIVIASERCYTTLASSPDSLPARTEVRFLDEEARREGGAELPISELEVTEVAAAEVTQLADLVSIAAEELGAGMTLGDRAVKGDLTGSVLDRKYVIEQKIGAGGFGAVYLAKHTALGSRVAVKVLNANAARAQGKEGFLEEARRLTKLKHENIVDWKDFGESEDGTLYFVMDFLEGGQELADVLKEMRARKESMSPERVADILLQMLEALRAAHHVSADESILHLDIKPQNVFLLPHPTDPERVRVKVIDFGIGQHVTRGEGAARPEPETDVVIEPTLGEAPTELATPLPEHAGSTIQMSAARADEPVQRVLSCTPEYAAPEQCAHLLPDREIVALDGRADLYAVGVMGYEMLAGKLHYPKPPNRRLLLGMHLDEPHTPLPVRGNKLRKGLCRFIEHSLAQDRDKRFADAREAYSSLRRVVHPPAWQLLAKVSAALVVAMLALVKFFGPDAAPATTYVQLQESSGELVNDSSRLAFGAGTELRLRVQSAGEVDTSRQWVLVGADASAERFLLDGWSTSWDADGETIILRAPDDLSGVPRLQGAWLVDALAEEGGFESRVQLQLLAMTPEALEQAVTFAGFEGVALDQQVDPTGRQFIVTVDAERWRPEDIERLQLVVQGQDPVELSLRLDNDGALIAAIDVDELSLEERTTELELQLRDAAGNQHTQRRYLPQLVTIPLTIDSLELTGASSSLSGEWMLFPSTLEDEVALEVVLSRPAPLTWRLITPQREFAGISPDNERRHRVVLDADSLDGLELAQLNGGESFQARLEVAVDDARFVLHASDDGRGRDEGQRGLTYIAGEASFTARVAGQALAGEEPFYTSAESLRLDLGLQGEATAALFDISVEGPPGAPAISGLTAERATITAGVANAIFDLELPVEGEYIVRAATTLVLSAGAGEDTIPGGEVEMRVVRDSSPPSSLGLEWSLGGSSLIDQFTGDQRPRWMFRLQDSSPGNLEWRIERAPDWQEIDTATMLIQRGLSDQREHSFEIEPSRPWTQDGTYRLRVWAQDSAGNGSTSRESEALAVHTYEVALEGPSMPANSIKEPSGTRWTAIEGERHRLTLELDDPNGVEAVQAIVRAVEQPALAVEVDLELEGELRPDGRSSWTAVVDFLHAWSNAEIELEVTARDLHGNRSGQLGPFGGYSFGRKREVFLELIALVDTAGEEFGRMRLVEPVQGSDYVFGGRDPQQENDAYRAAGLGREWNALRAIQKAYRSEDIGAYYLDEQEVSCADYLRFLEHESGYLDDAHWPQGAGRPSSGRRDELAGELGGRSPREPVSGVSWEEAWAFAAWCGKRLPSMVEWEFAARNGTDYRVFPDDGDGSGESMQGLRQLTSGVAEWTSVPRPASWSAPYGDVDDLWFLRPSEASSAGMDWPEEFERYFVVGGDEESDPDEVLPFYGAEHRSRGETSRAYIGFRCALDAREANALRSAGGETGAGLRLVQP